MGRDEPSTRRATRSSLGVVLTLVALAGIAAGAWLVFGNGMDPAVAAQWITVPDTQPRRPFLAPPPDPLVTPTGPIVLNLVGTPADFVAQRALPTAEASVLADAGVARIRAIVTRANGLSQGTWEFTVRDRSDPSRALHAIDDLYAAAAFTPVPAPPGVLARELTVPTTPATTTYRAHYRSGRDVIRVETYGADRAEVVQAGTRLLQRQLATDPVG